MKLTCTKKQLEIIQTALEIYGRLRMKQFDIMMENFNDKPLVGNAMCSIPRVDLDEFQKLGREIVFKNSNPETIYNRDSDGDISFAMHRQIHTFFCDSKIDSKRWCVTCDRSDMLVGEPRIKIEE